MDAATYRKESASLRSQINGLLTAGREENEKYSNLTRRIVQETADSPEHLRLEMEIYRLDENRKERIEEIKRLEQLKVQLDDERRLGFDFVRPGRQFVNKLLPPLVTMRKEVEYYDGDRDRRTAFVASLVMTVVSLGLFWLLTVIGASAGYFGGVALVDTAFPVTGTSSYVWAIIGGLVLTVSTPLTYLSRFHHMRMVKIWQRYLQDAEHWSIGQRLRVAAVYAAATPWTIWVPVLAVPFRFFLMLVGQVVYRHEMKKQDATPGLVDNATYKKAIRKSEYACVVAAVTVFTLLGIAMVALGALALIIL